MPLNNYIFCMPSLSPSETLMKKWILFKSPSTKHVFYQQFLSTLEFFFLGSQTPNKNIYSIQGSAWYFPLNSLVKRWLNELFCCCTISENIKYYSGSPFKVYTIEIIEQYKAYRIKLLQENLNALEISYSDSVIFGCLTSFNLIANMNTIQ